MSVKNILARLFKRFKLKKKGVGNMDEIEMHMEELKKAIRRSNEYTRYQILWEEISRNQALRGRLNDFRRERFLLNMNSGEDVIYKMECMSRDFADILEQPLVNDFLAAEQKMAKKVRYIENSVLEAVNLNVEFMS